MIDDTSIGVRLSEGLVEGGALAPAAVMRGLEALKEIVRTFDARNKRLRAVGTAALRKTGSPEIFTGPAREILGVDVEIISGQEEAKLTGRGAVLGLKGDGPWIIVDIGGQSTEVSWQEPSDARRAVSLPLGVVELTETYVRSDPPEPGEMDEVREHIRLVISDAVPRGVPGRLVGVAGTATTLGSMELGLTTWQPGRVHCLVMSRERLRGWMGKIVSITSSERTSRYGVRPVRADVFPVGICILQELMTYLDRDSFTVSVNGLRVGAALSILEGF